MGYRIDKETGAMIFEENNKMTVEELLKKVTDLEERVKKLEKEHKDV